MSSIYRVRPARRKSVEEIKEHYLWFSRPTSYWDPEDAKVSPFLNSNESIEKAFKELYKDYKEVVDLAALSGICCFAESLPDPDILGDFPAANNGLVIEYDRGILEKFFINKYGLGDCFKKVEYLEEPTLFESSNDYDILWERIGSDKVYKSLKSIISNEKEMDSLFLKIFTRINKKYDNQNELRVILSGANVPDKSDDLKGYRIEIPKQTIKKVYLHNEMKEAIKEEIKELELEVEFFG